MSASYQKNKRKIRLEEKGSVERKIFVPDYIRKYIIAKDTYLPERIAIVTDSY